MFKSILVIIGPGYTILLWKCVCSSWIPRRFLWLVDQFSGVSVLPFMRVLRSSCSYFTFIYCHFHFLLSFGTRTLIRFLSFSFRKLRKEILRCTFPLKKVIWRVIKSIHICNCQKQYLNSLFPPKLSKEAHKKMSFIETYLEHWPFRRHCLHFTSRSNLGRNRQWLK